VTCYVTPLTKSEMQESTDQRRLTHFHKSPRAVHLLIGLREVTSVCPQRRLRLCYDRVTWTTKLANREVSISIRLHYTELFSVCSSAPNLQFSNSVKLKICAAFGGREREAGCAQFQKFHFNMPCSVNPLSYTNERVRENTAGMPLCPLIAVKDYLA